MQEERTTLVRRLGQALHTYYDGIAGEPLPQRWVDLIHHLNERERRERQGERIDQTVDRADQDRQAR